MSALQVPLCAADRARIDSIVSDFRHTLERLYEIAYIQGQIDQANETREQLRKALA